MNPEEACIIQQDLSKHYGYVYCLTFPNGKCYVGQTKQQWRYRWSGHKDPNSQCIALRRALNKYGYIAPEWTVLGYADSPQELNKMQEHYINKKCSLSPGGYNLRSSQIRGVVSQETRQRLSNVMRQQRSRPVHCVELNETFQGAAYAVDEHPEWDKRKIAAVCLGLRNTHHGLHFYYMDDTEQHIQELKQNWIKEIQHKFQVQFQNYIQSCVSYKAS